MSSLKDRISDETKAAMRGGDKARLAALRLILAALKQQEVDTRETLDDDSVQNIIGRLIKKGRDAAEQFERGGRTDLAAKELAEIAVFENFMPQQLSAEETTAAIAAAITATGAAGIKDMGKVMARLKTTVGGRADMGALSAQVRAALAND